MLPRRGVRGRSSPHPHTSSHATRRGKLAAVESKVAGCRVLRLELGQRPLPANRRRPTPGEGGRHLSTPDLRRPSSIRRRGSRGRGAPRAGPWSSASPCSSAVARLVLLRRDGRRTRLRLVLRRADHLGATSAAAGPRLRIHSRATSAAGGLRLLCIRSTRGRQAPLPAHASSASAQGRGATTRMELLRLGNAASSRPPRARWSSWLCGSLGEEVTVGGDGMQRREGTTRDERPREGVCILQQWMQHLLEGE
jgi:hypothetical protein